MLGALDAKSGQLSSCDTIARSSSQFEQELKSYSHVGSSCYLTYTRARKKGPRLAIAEIGTGYRWPSL